MAALPAVDIPAYLAYVPASLVVAGNADGTKVAASLDTQLVAALDCRTHFWHSFFFFFSWLFTSELCRVCNYWFDLSVCCRWGG